MQDNATKKLITANRCIALFTCFITSNKILHAASQASVIFEMFPETMYYQAQAMRSIYIAI